MRTTNGSDDDDCIVGGSGKPGVNMGVGVNGVRGIRGTIGLLGTGSHLSRDGRTMDEMSWRLWYKQPTYTIVHVLICISSRHIIFESSHVHTRLRVHAIGPCSVVRHPWNCKCELPPHLDLLHHEILGLGCDRDSGTE